MFKHIAMLVGSVALLSQASQAQTTIVQASYCFENLHAYNHTVKACRQQFTMYAEEDYRSGERRVQFLVISNSGPGRLVITGVYFEGFRFTQRSGVGLVPADIFGLSSDFPNGDLIGFVSETAAVAAPAIMPDADGIAPGESFTFIDEGAVFSVIDHLNSGTTRIGITVAPQNGNGASQSLVNVPVPLTFSSK